MTIVLQFTRDYLPAAIGKMTNPESNEVDTSPA
jgi:hypothetical protein